MKKVFAVVKINCIFDSENCGLFSTKEKAIRHATILAKQFSYKKHKNKLQWGHKDHYGLIEGILINEIKVL